MGASSNSPTLLRKAREIFLKIDTNLQVSPLLLQSLIMQEAQNNPKEVSLSEKTLSAIEQHDILMCFQTWQVLKTCQV